MCRVLTAHEQLAASFPVVCPSLHGKRECQSSHLCRHCDIVEELPRWQQVDIVEHEIFFSGKEQRETSPKRL